jgi:hypothetical protein
MFSLPEDVVGINGKSRSGSGGCGSSEYIVRVLFKETKLEYDDRLRLSPRRCKADELRFTTCEAARLCLA